MEKSTPENSITADKKEKHFGHDDAKKIMAPSYPGSDISVSLNKKEGISMSEILKSEKTMESCSQSAGNYEKREDFTDDFANIEGKTRGCNEIDSTFTLGPAYLETYWKHEDLT